MNCPTCSKAELVSAVVMRRVDVAKHRYVSMVPALKCPACGAEFVNGEATIRANLEAAQHIATHGPVTGEGFTFIRDALGLQAQQLAPLLGRRPEALSRWENDRGEIDRAAWAVLGAMVAERLAGRDDTLERMRTLVHAKKVPVTVKLEASRK